MTARADSSALHRPAIINPRDEARRVIAELGIQDRKLLMLMKEICCERGAYVRTEKIEGADGRLVVAGTKGVITVSENERYPGRPRFSMAHELGHFELHRDSRRFWRCMDTEIGAWIKPSKSDPFGMQEFESQANEFAAELLMPDRFLRSWTQWEEPSIALVREIARSFEVSLFAAVHRLLEISSHACAVVFSQEGVMTHSRVSQPFFRQGWRVRAGRRLHPQTLMSRKIQERNAHIASSSDTPAAAWLSVPMFLAREHLREESIVFPRIGIGMSLITLYPGSRLYKKYLT